MRHRNKLLLVFLVFLFAALFVGSMIAKAKGFKYTNVISIGAQIGLGISILLYFIVPDKPKDD